MKNSIRCASALVLAAIALPESAQGQLEVSGGHTLGVRRIAVSPNSSKFNEYRDLRDGLYLRGLTLDVFDPANKWFLDLEGKELIRDDQSILLRLGNPRSRLRAVIDNNRIPHRLSNRAMSPYIHQGNGLFTLPAPVSITKDGDSATGTPSLVPTAGEMEVNDALIANYVETFKDRVTMNTQRDRTTATLSSSPAASLNVTLAFLNEYRDGNRTTAGPIGDRPPRTLNVQLAEPVNYTTREVSAGADYAVSRFQMGLNYLFSVFNNRSEVLRWQNMYFAPDAGRDFITTVPATPRNVSDFGQRSIAPDNYAHSLSLTAGFDLPLRSRLTSTVALGLMRQNEELLPYSSSTLGGDLAPGRGDGLSWNDPLKLPLSRADAEMLTLRIDVDYNINPISRLELRPFVRYYNLDNNTPTAEWRYVTQDAAGTNGDVNYRNQRRNLAYAYGNLKIGLDARHYFSFWRTSVGAGFAQERIEREFREADTDENIFEASVRTSPTRRLALAARYLFGDRTNDGYNYNVTSQSYWYSFEQGAADVDNPRFLFANHPDLRKYDVSDRNRNELRLSATYIAHENIDVTTSYRYRKEDFDSDVAPVAPFAGTTVPLPNPADTSALTPGQQLGLLQNARHDITANVHFVPAERWAITLFAELEFTDSDQRGMVFNENQRREPSNPSIQSPTQLGPWTDPDRIYNAGIEEGTTTIGVGIGYEVIPGRLRLLTDFSVSRARVDLDYTGYGSDADFLGRDWETFQFGFDDPETVKYNQSFISASLEYNLPKNLILGLHYLYNVYHIEDWVQEPLGPWVEEVGSEFFLRDTSRDNRWGNRLVPLGGYLAPSYEAHVVSVALSYRF